MSSRIIAFSVLLAVSFLLSGCTTLWQDYFGDRNLRQGVSSSLVDYLYPDGEVPPQHEQTVPSLELPLHVGLAFVPANQRTTPGLSEARKSLLLEKVRQSFADREFISQITVVPDTYLRSKQGFDSVDQVARLYGLDVMALVSYDQVALSDDTRASLFYWTIVGAYLVKGSANDVQTFVDTAIFDVKTHKLLFRAPGVDQLKSTSTLVNSATKMREAREQSFDLAMTDMTANLGNELETFRERIKEDKSVTITHSASYSGGGGSSGPLTVIVLLLACLLVWSRRSRMHA